MILALIIQTAPLYIAALGGLLSELSGRLNIGLEGAILFGAFAAAASYLALPSLPLALLAATASGAVLGWVSGYLSIRRQANVFIVGLGINLMAWGFIPLLSQVLFGSKGVVNLLVDSQFQNQAGWTGLGAAVVIGAALSLFLARHSTGIRLRKIHLDETSAAIQGTDVAAYQFSALILSSALSALAGGLISLHLGSYVPNLSAGKGWIALVIIYLGNRRPLSMLGAAAVFALSQLLSNEAQRFISAPGILLGMPYLITLAALISYRAISAARKQGIRRSGE